MFILPNKTKVKFLLLKMAVTVETCNKFITMYVYEGVLYMVELDYVYHVYEGVLCMVEL